MPVFLSYVFLVICAIILAIIGVIISFLGEKACLSRQCIGQAKFIRRSMNKELDPCDDFYSFVCNNFAQYGTSIVDEIEIKQLKRLVEYLEVPADWDIDERVEHIAKSLYQNLKNDTKLNLEGVLPMFRTLTRMGSIPFLDSDWNEEYSADFNAVDYDLKQIYVGFNPVFVTTRVIKLKTNPKLSPKNESDQEKMEKMFHSFSIPPHLYHASAPDPDNYLEYCTAFTDLYISDLKKTGLKINKTITEQDKLEIKEAANFKIKFLKIIPKTKHCSQRPFDFVLARYSKGLGRYNAKRRRNGTELKYYPMRKAMPGQITKSFFVVTGYFEKYIDDLNELIANVSDRALANFMGVEALIQMTPFLPVPYRDIYDEYLKPEKDKHNRVIRDRSIYCAKLIKDAMPAPLSAQYLRDHPTPPEGIAVLNSITAQILMQVKGILKGIKWASKKDQYKMLNLLSKLKIVSPLPSDVINQLKNQIKLEAFSSIICTDVDSTLESYLQIRICRETRNAQILNQNDQNKPQHKFTVYHEDFDIFDPDIYFQEDSNSVVLPMGYLYYPSLDSLWPKYLNYGGLGLWIAHKIIKTIGYDNVLHPGIVRSNDPMESPRFKERWWEKETKSGYKQNRECALKEYNEYLKPFGVKCNDDNCLAETLYYAASLKAAYFSYKESTRMRFFVEPKLPYLTKYKVEQIFFIKFASSFCQYEGVGKRFMNDQDTAIVPNNFTVIYGLRNLPQFREVFQCGDNDRMTKADPCKT